MIYDRIKKICKNKGLSVAKLEQDLGLGRSSVRRFDQHEPGVGKLNMIAGYLGVTVDSLLDDDYYADGEKAPGADAEALEAMRALSKMDISGIYNDLTIEERRRFWRGIIRTIWVGKDRSIRLEFMAISAGNN